MPAASALLHLTDVGTARQGLRLLVVASLLALIAASLFAAGDVRIAGMSVGVIGLLFWGLPFHGQGLSHAPGDALLMLGLAVFVRWRRRIQPTTTLVVFSASFGSLITYLDFLTGQIPTAACLLFLLVFAARYEGTARSGGSDRAWRGGCCALIAFSLGCLMTVAVKQLLVAALIGPDLLAPFVSNLRFYTGASAAVDDLPALYAGAFFSLVKLTPVLTYYSIPAGACLLLASAIAWISAGVLAVRSPVGTDRRPLFLAHAVAALGIAGWVVILPMHTQLHAGFMVRMLIVPLALGWSAVASQRWRGSRASPMP